MSQSVQEITPYMPESCTNAEVCPKCFQSERLVEVLWGTPHFARTCSATSSIRDETRIQRACFSVHFLPYKDVLHVLPIWFFLIPSFLANTGYPDWRVGIATGYGLDDPESIPGNARLLSTTSRPALGPTQTPIQWVPGAISSGV
jgi:hypothetical protein